MSLIWPLDEESFRAPEGVPVFPLPDMVLLPGEPLPLHIFEQRYKLMTESAISSEKLIAMAHLKPGWEKEQEGSPEIYPIAGLGRIMADERLADGRFNLMLVGLKRVRLGRFMQDRPYRIAQVEVLADHCSRTAPALLSSLESEIIALSRRMLKLVSGEVPADRTAPLLESLSPGALPLGGLCDLAAAAFPLSSVEKQMILEETDIIARAEKLIFTLRCRLESPGDSSGRAILH